MELYQLNANLMQAIINSLNQQPAYQVRNLLNELEHVVSEQDKTRDRLAKEAEIEAAIKVREAKPEDVEQT